MGQFRFSRSVSAFLDHIVHVRHRYHCYVAELIMLRRQPYRVATTTAGQHSRNVVAGAVDAMVRLRCALEPYEAVELGLEVVSGHFDAPYSKAVTKAAHHHALVSGCFCLASGAYLVLSWDVQWPALWPPST
jgi:hypothetical protein